MKKGPVRNFFSRMFSSDSGVSSKRVISFIILINVIIFCYVATFLGKIIPEFMFDGLALVGGGGIGLTAIENIFRKGGTKKNINNEPEQQ
jgi:hypothetical protein